MGFLRDLWDRFARASRQPGDVDSASDADSETTIGGWSVGSGDHGHEGHAMDHDAGGDGGDSDSGGDSDGGDSGGDD